MSSGASAIAQDYFIRADGPLKPSDAVAALQVREDGRYVMQLRDAKPNIFYPDHWGCFGGAVDAGGGVPAGLDAFAADVGWLDEGPGAEADELVVPLALAAAEAPVALAAALSLAGSSPTPALSFGADGGVTSVAFRSRVACGRLPD